MFTDSLQITYENQIGTACLENISFLDIMWATLFI